MEFIVVVLGLFTVAAAHFHYSLSSRTSHRPIISKFRPIGPSWGSNAVNPTNPHNLDPSIDISQPFSPQDFGMYANPMEDDQQAQDIALYEYLTKKYDRTANSYDWSSSLMQNNQLPYPVGFINPKYFYQPYNLAGYAPNSGLPGVPIQEISSAFAYYPSTAREGEDVPKWTSFANTTRKMGDILRTNMISPETTNHERMSDPNWLNDRALYTLLIGVVLELMDEVAKGKDQDVEFFKSYLPFVLSIMEKPSVTPHKLAKGIWDRMMDIDDGNYMLRSYIGFMNNSIYCNNSSQCDKVIDDTLKTTANQRFQDEAKLLLAQFEFADLFLSNYAAEFETKATNLAVSAYLGDIDNNNLKIQLKPLVLAGAELIKRREEIGPLQPLDLSVFPTSNSLTNLQS